MSTWIAWFAPFAAASPLDSPGPAPDLAGLVQSFVDGVEIEAPGPVRVVHQGPLDLTWMEVAPDGSVAVTAGYRAGRVAPVLEVIDLATGDAKALAAPAPGEVLLPRFLDNDGRSWRMVAAYVSGPATRRGLYTFRLDAPAATWTPWAVTGTYIRDFWLVEDRTEALLLSFVPDGKRDSDRLDVVPLTDGKPDVARMFRVAPEVRAVQFEDWSERDHRFVFENLFQATGPYRSVQLVPGAVSSDYPAGANHGIHRNPYQAATDLVYSNDGPPGTSGLWPWGIAANGDRRPLLRCDGQCQILAFSPVRREFWFRLREGDHDVLLASPY